jgi:deazaflavin-dependent oxidoreductase (nitroreductase family)
MATQLTYVDPSRPPGFLRRAYSFIGTTRLARFISRHVFWKLDPILLRLTGGHLASTMVIRTAVLETRGARSGAVRRNAIIYFHDGERVTIVASNAGGPTHPAWYHNVRAHPDVTFADIPMHAHVVEREHERKRLEALGDNVFPAFASYRRAAAELNRTVPIVQLTRSEAGAS